MTAIRILHNWGKDVHLNIAYEQAILHYSIIEKVPTVRIWKNPYSIVVGRGQEIAEEINQNFCRANNIVISRRISGGGAVYHDLGNLNVSFFFPWKIIPVDRNIEASALFFTEIIVNTLKSMNYENLTIESGSNIFYRGKKISGSAGRTRSGWHLHHATLLVNADLELMDGSLLIRSHDHGDKRKSRYFPTTNLPEFEQPIFETELENELFTQFGWESYQSEPELLENRFARALYEQIYSTEKWIRSAKFRRLKIEDYK